MSLFMCCFEATVTALQLSLSTLWYRCFVMLFCSLLSHIKGYCVVKHIVALCYSVAPHCAPSSPPPAHLFLCFKCSIEATLIALQLTLSTLCYRCFVMLFCSLLSHIKGYCVVKHIVALCYSVAPHCAPSSPPPAHLFLCFKCSIEATLIALQLTLSTLCYRCFVMLFCSLLSHMIGYCVVKHIVALCCSVAPHCAPSSPPPAHIFLCFKCSIEATLISLQLSLSTLCYRCFVMLFCSLLSHMKGYCVVKHIVALCCSVAPHCAPSSPPPAHIFLCFKCSIEATLISLQLSLSTLCYRCFVMLFCSLLSHIKGYCVIKHIVALCCSVAPHCAPSSPPPAHSFLYFKCSIEATLIALQLSLSTLCYRCFVMLFCSLLSHIKGYCVVKHIVALCCSVAPHCAPSSPPPAHSFLCFKCS